MTPVVGQQDPVAVSPHFFVPERPGEHRLAFRQVVSYISAMMDKTARLIIAMAFLATAAGCSKRQVVPGVLAGTGAAAIAGGVGYRASLGEAEEVFGDTAKEKGITTTLLLTGTALVIAGIVWSVTTPVCENDGDCWVGDVCEKKTNTCVPRPDEAPPEAAPETEASETSFLKRDPVDLAADAERCVERF